MLTNIELSAADWRVVETAFAASPYKMLTVFEFTQKSGFNINHLMVDRFFHTLRRKLNVYVDGDLINYLGYEAENDIKKKQCLMALIKRNKSLALNVDYFIDNNKQYAVRYANIAAQLSNPKSENTEDSKTGEKLDTHMSIQIMRSLGFPHPSEFLGVNGKGTTTHLILTTHCFKKIMMMVNTSKADTIREFYIAIENLIMVYSGYQTEFVRRENANLSREVIELKEIRRELNQHNATLLAEMQKANYKLDVQGENIIGVLGHLGAVSNHHVPPGRIPAKKSESLWIVRVPDAALPYHVFRAQEQLCNQSYLNLVGLNSKTEKIRVFRNHPNPREEFICFRERAGKNILCRGNKFCLTMGFAEADLIQLLDLVHAEKMVEYEKEFNRLYSDSEDEFEGDKGRNSKYGCFCDDDSDDSDSDDAKSEDKPVDVKSEDKPVDAKSEDKPVDAKSEDKPVDAKSEDTGAKEEYDNSSSDPDYEENHIETKSEEWTEDDVTEDDSSRSGSPSDEKSDAGASTNTGEHRYTYENLLAMKLEQLKVLARSTGASRWSKLSKVQLVNWLLIHLNS